MHKCNFLRLITISTILIISFTVFGETILQGQETDQFYLNILKRGEKSFFEKNYEDAIKELEIAAFGLHEERGLRAKAYIYLSIAYYNQKNLEKSKKYVNNALNLIGDNEVSSLDIPDSVKPTFQELIDYFKDKETQKISVESINKLEMKLRSDPRSESTYYELFELYKRANNLERAKKKLKDLLNVNPTAVKGLNLLGIIYYNEQRYREAEKNFEKLFELAGKYKINQNILEEAGAYFVLTLHHQGDRKRALIIIAGLINYFTEERIQSLPLRKTDKIALQHIIETYKRRSSGTRET